MDIGSAAINFRCQIENQVSDYRLLGAFSFVYNSKMSAYKCLSIGTAKLENNDEMQRL
jgi:hypothetical protein